MGQSLSRIYIAVGIALLAAMLSLILWSPGHGGTSSVNDLPIAIMPARTSDFLISDSLPPAVRTEATALLQTIQTLADQYAHDAARDARWSNYLQWAAFVLSSVIVLLAGAWGKAPHDATTQELIGAIASQSADNTTAGGSTTAANSSRGTRRRSRTRMRNGFAASVGVVAALSAVCTGASNRLQASAAQRKAVIRTISDAVISTSKVLAEPTSTTDINNAFERLRNVVRENAT